DGTNVERLALGQIFLILPSTITSSATTASNANLDDVRSLDAERALTLASNGSLAPLQRAEISRYHTLSLQSTTDQRSALSFESVTVRSPGGFFQAGIVLNNGTILGASPPLVILPADAGEGTQPWHSSGALGTIAYTYAGKITDRGSHDSALGSFSDCLTAETSLVLGTDATASTTDTSAVYCSGVGLVERTDTTTRAGQPDSVEATTVLSTTNLSGATTATPTPSAKASDTSAKELGSPDTWALTRFGRTAPTGVSVGAAATPVFVPSDPPQVVGVDEAGSVVAYDTTTGLEAWRFHAASAVYGRPFYDAASGTILFGSADRRVYAVDSRGVFKWSFATGDNIASRPIVVDGTVVVGSEDRNVYGLDVSTGASRWVVNDSAAVASSPAVAQGIVAIGDDDGNLLGIDPSDGSTKWAGNLPGPAEGAVATDGSTFFVGSSGDELNFGSVTAIDATSGDTVWTSRIPNPSRVEVAIGDNLVFSVDTSGVLDALDKATGAPRYETKSLYAGNAVAVGDTAVAIRFDGTVDVFDDRGTIVKTFSAADAVSKVDSAPDFTLGLSDGGGAIWAADANAVVYRLGPGDPAISPLALRFLASSRSPGLDHGPLTMTPVEHDGQAVVVDGLGGVSLVDPSDGSSRAVGEFDTTKSVPRTDPVVSGDLVIAAVSGDLQAMDLNTGTLAWTVKGDGFSFAAPVVTSDGLVLWADALAATTTGELRAIDAASGTVRWTVALPDVTGVAPALADGVVIASSPPTAFDLRTGAAVWTASAVKGSPVGAAAFDPSTRTVVAAIATTDGSHVVGLDASTGQVRWDRPLPITAFDPAQPVAIDGSTAVVSAKGPGPIVGVDVRTGTTRWTFQPTANRFGITFTDGGVLYVVLDRGAVLAVDVSTGTQAGRFIDLDLPLRSFDRSLPHPAVVNGTVVVALGSFLAGLEPPGPR
ncbi:MAG: hypothetical protein QOG39_874, partial [Acidimicrobiaceae bacterium]